MFNYWTLEPYELPSRGLYYPKDFEIRIRPLNVSEVKYLATLNSENATKVCNEILLRCIELKNITYNDIVLADREYMAFWIRCNSFTQNSGYTITVPHCKGCKEEVQKEIRLESFKTVYVKSDVKEVYLPDIGATISLKQPRIADLHEYCSMPNPDETIREYAMYLDSDNTIDEKYSFILKLTAYDFAILKDSIDQIHCGMHNELNIECPRCHALNPVKLIINDMSLFGATKLTDILTTITHIAKYAHLQIDNDWPWVEVELEQKIVNDMIEQENKETNKAMSKANAQQAAAQAKANAAQHSMHSVPHYNVPHR